jgi:hypothetical protein
MRLDTYRSSDLSPMPQNAKASMLQVKGERGSIRIALERKTVSELYIRPALALVRRF